MGKRAATSAAKGHASKAAKTTAAPIAAELQLLAMAELPDACREMLEAMLPHVWSTAVTERHPHQTTIAETFSTIIAGVISQKQQAIDVAKANGAEVRDTVLKLAEQIAAAEGALTAQQEVADAAAKQTEGQTAQRLAAAKAALQAAKTKQAGLGDELTKAEADKTAFDDVCLSAWEPIKAGTLTGKEKEQAIKKLQQTFKSLHLQDSFLDAVAGAAKVSGDDRGVFSQAVVEFAETTLQRHISSCASTISGFDVATSQCTADTAAAEAELNAAKEAQGLVEDAMIAAENALLEVREKFDAVAEAKTEAEGEMEAAQAVIASAEGEMEAAQALNAQVGKSDISAASQADAPEAEAEVGGV